MTGKRSSLVVLIHGLSAKKMLMLPMAMSIRQSGFQTSSFGYVSVYGSLRHHADRFRKFLQAKLERHSPVHIVAHSMGTAITRIALSTMDCSQIGRVLMLAPPNKGVRIARYVGPLVKMVCPAISELSDQPNSLINQVSAPANYDAGVIAARFDWMIAGRNTVLENSRAHITLAATHNSLLIQPQAFAQVKSFLETGHFDRHA